MSYIEVGKALFRGTLRGANGEAKFKLSAQAIDAVDTINIGSGEVSYLQSIHSGPKYWDWDWDWTDPNQADSFGLILHFVIDVSSDYTFMEIDAYGHNARYLRLDGVTQPDRFRSNVGNPLFTHTQLTTLSKGEHTIALFADYNYNTGATYSEESWIVAKFLKETGSDG